MPSVSDKDPASAFRRRRPASTNQSHSAAAGAAAAAGDPLALYAAPTTSSLRDDDDNDDESSYQPQLVRPYQAQTPTKYRKPLDQQSKPHKGGSSTSQQQQENKKSTSASAAAAAAAASAKAASSSVRQQQDNSNSKPQSSRRRRTSSSPPHLSNNAQQSTTNANNTSPNSSSSSNRDFQHATDFPSVTVRHVNVQQRSAFDVPQLTAIQEWKRIASYTRQRRLSPPLQHLERLHRLFGASNNDSSNTILRQVQFSPSTGLDADCFYAQTAQMLGEAVADETLLLSSSRQRQQQRASSKRRDGRYRSLDPLQTAAAARMLGISADSNHSSNSNSDHAKASTTTSTTTPPPILSHKKYRLPNRSDVGFPNATPADMERKQQEIRHETDWEEVSPRLIVWVTSDRLGSSVVVKSNNGNNQHESSSSSHGTSAVDDAKNASSYSSYVGRDLQLAKFRNAQHFGGTTTAATNTSEAASLPPHLRPNPYSMLAPPLGSTFSPSQGWRPRAFHDRPAGMRYACACPLQVNLGTSVSQKQQKQQQPPLMVGSLSLYTLPPLYRDQLFQGAAAAAAYHCSRQRQGSKNSTPAYGKLSEAFWFPIQPQQWQSKVDFPAVRLNNKNGMDAELLASWVERQHKAVFAYDPLDLVMESNKKSAAHGTNGKNDNTDPASLFVVLHVYKIATATSSDLDPAATDWEKVFAEYGTQLLTPVSFGVTKFFSSKGAMNWPDGQIKEIQLYAYPSPESQEQFVERLWGIVYQRYANPPGLTSPLLLDDNNSATSLSAATEADAVSLTMTEASADPAASSTKKKGGGFKSRLFRSPKSSRPRTPVPTHVQQRPADLRQRSVSTGSLASLSHTHATGTAPPVSEAIDGSTARLFLSSLSTDFLQSMLVTPREMEDHNRKSTSTARKKQLPKLLVDISGDFAVLLDRSESIVPAELETRGDSVSKRSNLLRLPAPVDPAGYSGSAEFREILYLPARPERHYDVDSHFGSCRTILNLLYLYPRLLRRSSPTSSDSNVPANLADFTVRIRLVHTSSVVDDETQRTVQRSAPVACFHNTTPWAGPTLLESIYTKFPGGRGLFREDVLSGVPLRDEIKVRLPDVLDGNYRVEFTLFALEPSATNGGGISLQHISEASVPLSSSSSARDGVGSRVATIIPNGKHRLELGSFQLHLETRLVSSVHVGDAAVATALRDLPVTKNVQATDLLLGVSNHSVSSLETSTLATTTHSPKLLAGASESTVAGYFQILLYVHLFDLIQSASESAAPESPSVAAMMGSMQSLFEVLRKVKAKFQSGVTVDTDNEKIKMFLKRNLDTFDEAYLSERHQSAKQDEVDDDADGITDTKTLSASQEEDTESEQLLGEARDDFAVNRRGSSISKRHRDSRAARIQAALGPTGVPFSRVAYGATKTDRMLVEAELRHDGTHFMPFFDDDETIATAQSLHSSGTAVVKQDAGPRIQGPPVTRKKRNGAKSIQRTASPTSQQSAAPLDDRHYTIGDTDFAKRMRVAAQVMLAPCVAPSLSTALSKCGQGTKEGTASGQKKETFFTREIKDGGGLTGAMAWLCAPGSDTEDDAESAAGGQDSLPVRKYRGLFEDVALSFSVTGGAEDEIAVGRGKYVYETIIVLWLRAWLDHVEKCFRRPQKRSGRQTATFDVPPFDPSATQPGTAELIFLFYQHMDFLLPLCLKSIVMRYGEDVLSRYPHTSKVMLDEGHLEKFEPFVEMLARGLVGQALSGMSTPEAREVALRRALDSSDVVNDFLLGLFGVLHSEHMCILLTKYFSTIVETETEHLGDNISASNFEWTEGNLHRVRCSRQLRIRAIEKLAVAPFFLAVNYPLKYPGSVESSHLKKATWLKQHNEIDAAALFATEEPLIEDGVEKLPRSGWLARLLITDCLSVCSLSCEAVVAEAIAHIESSNHSQGQSASTKRPGASLKRADLLMFQDMGIHAIEIVYELILRRQAMDRRFQSDSARGRIAGLLARPILEMSVESVRWLARMEATHKVRSTWLLSFAYILQEAPESLLRDFVQSCCNPQAVRIHRFIRLLRLCTSSFQGFIDRRSVSNEPDKTMSPWLLQESFNTICATTNVVVEVCVGFLSSYPGEQRKTMRGILDLLLHVLTTPQSSVTHLRAVGGALQALEFDVDLFLEAAGANFQHWVRIILSLMNSISLSVRSIAVDWVVSLLGSTYKLHGCIDALSLIFTTVLPEIVAREIALYSVSGNISTFDDIAKSVWPIRRSIADLQDTNPLDDDRVDPQLAPIISVFCRACQAIVDGVLLELRLQEGGVIIVGTEIQPIPPGKTTFDAEEESLFEAATFFVPEIAPMQRIRWLLTLKSLHETKEQWVEAAETLFLCARTICDAIPHLKNVWRPSRFALWSDSRHSLWLETVGEEQGVPDRGNAEMMDFADHFLEPASFLGSVWKPSKPSDKLKQPTISTMCSLLADVAKEAVVLYLKEDGMDEIAYTRLESLLKVLMSVVEDHSALPIVRSASRPMSFVVRKKQVEEEASLRKVCASISGDMTRLAERLLSIVENETGAADFVLASRPSRAVYVLLRLYGKKPPRFQESTTIPTFLEWDKPCICRVPKSITEGRGGSVSMEKICIQFAQPYMSFLSQEVGKSNVILRTSPSVNYVTRDDRTYVAVVPVEGTGNDPFQLSLASKRSKHFVHRQEPSTIVETTVAKEFPCALSRQSSLLTTEIMSTRTPSHHA